MTTETTIYDHHDKAFAGVSAYIITKGGERVATIALKFPKDGAGRLWAYVQWLGSPMVRGFAGGYGYDKRSAAVAAAVSKMELIGAEHVDDRAAQIEFRKSLIRDDGHYFDARLRAAGFEVWQAV